MLTSFSLNKLRQISVESPSAPPITRANWLRWVKAQVEVLEQRNRTLWNQHEKEQLLLYLTAIWQEILTRSTTDRSASRARTNQTPCPYLNAACRAKTPIQTRQKSSALNAGTGQLGQLINLIPTNQEQQPSLTSLVRIEKSERPRRINQETVLVLLLQRTNIYKSK